MKKFYDIEIDSQIELENGKTLGKLEESKISVNDGNCGSGSASDPIVENAKQTGGIGYTEQGEQTVIVDNESVTTEGDEGDTAFGGFETQFEIELNAVYTVIFNGMVYENLTPIDFDGGYIIGEFNGRWDFSNIPFAVVQHPEIGLKLATQNASTNIVTIKSVSETTHKIDDKYINFKPVVTAHFQEVDGELECDTDFATMKEAALENRLVATLDGGRQVLHVSSFRSTDNVNCLVFQCMLDEKSYQIYVDRNLMSIKKFEFVFNN